MIFRRCEPCGFFHGGTDKGDLVGSGKRNELAVAAIFHIRVSGQEHAGIRVNRIELVFFGIGLFHQDAQGLAVTGNSHGGKRRYERGQRTAMEHLAGEDVTCGGIEHGELGRVDASFRGNEKVGSIRRESKIGMEGCADAAHHFSGFGIYQPDVATGFAGVGSGIEDVKPAGMRSGPNFHDDGRSFLRGGLRGRGILTRSGRDRKKAKENSEEYFFHDSDQI